MPGNDVDSFGATAAAWEGEGLAGEMDVSMDMQLSGLHGVLGPTEGDGGNGARWGSGVRGGTEH